MITERIRPVVTPVCALPSNLDAKKTSEVSKVCQFSFRFMLLHCSDSLERWTPECGKMESIIYLKAEAMQ